MNYSDHSGLERLIQVKNSVKNMIAENGFVHAKGHVVEITPSCYLVSGLSRFVKLGDCVSIELAQDEQFENEQYGQIISIGKSVITVKSFGSNLDIRLGTAIWTCGSFTVRPDTSWNGRILNGLGQPIDGRGSLVQGDCSIKVDRPPPNAMRRKRVNAPIQTGIKAIDLFTPLCRGQRLGVFAGSGVGKSTFLAMLARSQDFDRVVFALVGERGREVREFIEDAIGSNASNAIGIVSTSDESAMIRRMAPKVATVIAEYFRDRGEHVLLIVDSITRFAHASRDILLASGETPVARGYPPEVFSELPKLLERAGTGYEDNGTITGIFSVLVDGDDLNDPVADNIRGTLDGHIVLDRSIAEQGRYPAVNILSSISRLAKYSWTAEQEKLILMLRSFVARYEDSRDLRLIGGYTPGVDLDVDQAVAWVPKIYDTLTQELNEPHCEDVFAELSKTLSQ